MLKIFYIYLILALLFGSSYVGASSPANNDDLLIIPRASWGANSLYNDVNSIYWKPILESRANYVAPKRSPEAIAAAKEKSRKINSYLNENFSEQFTVQETITFNSQTATEYAWDLKYAKLVDSIIVHHTHSEYDDDISGLNQIHKYHSLNRQWGDIGYNFIIGYDGVIYEGREGGDYVVGAHSKYNNIGTIGIAILGNYDAHGITDSQYNSLEQLIQYLTQKYGIDLSKKRYYHMDCKGIKCDTFPLETYLDSVLIGHRDATHTNCPGDELYEQIQQIRTDNLELTKGYQPIIRGEKVQKQTLDTSLMQTLLTALQKYDQKQKIALQKLIDTKLEQSTDQEITKKLQILRLAVKLSLD